jgi:hypothetical protein
MTVTRIFFLVASLAALGACAGPEPFVYQAGEFNREREDFGRPPKDRDEAIVCYAAHSTTPEQVRALARKACGEVGKRAVFREHVFSDCPLATPSAALFACVSP